MKYAEGAAEVLRRKKTALNKPVVAEVMGKR